MSALRRFRRLTLGAFASVLQDVVLPDVVGNEAQTMADRNRVLSGLREMLDSDGSAISTAAETSAAVDDACACAQLWTWFAQKLAQASEVVAAATVSERGILVDVMRGHSLAGMVDDELAALRRRAVELRQEVDDGKVACQRMIQILPLEQIGQRVSGVCRPMDTSS